MNNSPPEELVYQALRTDVPNQEKKDLLDALHRAPQIVKDESNPLNFLLSNGSCSPKHAAKRLAKYWRIRRICFQERAFLPMNITGNGAMSAEDIKIVKKGSVAILPDDRDGNRVVYCDKRVFEGLPVGVRMRCCFYILQIATVNMKSHDHKFLTICAVSKVEFTAAAKEILTACDEAFPGNFLGFHTVLVSPIDGKNLYGLYEVLAQFATLMVNMMGINIARKKAKLYSGLNSASQMREKLIELGLRVEGIPTLLGGTWGEEQFRSWLMSQINFEKAKIAKSRLAARGQLQRSVSFDQHQVETLRNRTSQSCQQPHEPKSPFISVPNSISMHLQNFPNPGENDIATRGRNLIRQDSAVSALSVFEDLTTASHPTESSSLQPVASRHDLNQYKSKGIVPGPVVFENEATIKEARTSFEAALGMMPEYQKRAYLEALKQAPELMNTEMDPLRFLRVEDFDGWKAARRFCRCWELREKLFGQRVFFPMTQTGNGALTHRDVVSLNTGVAVSLPKDISNRGVLLIDRSRNIDGEDEEATQSMLRSFFYLLSVFSENQTNQVQGIVCIIFVYCSRDINMGSKVFIQRAEMSKVLPVKVMAVHFVVCPPKGERKSTADRLYADTLQVSQKIFGKVSLVHRTDNRSEVPVILESFGLSKTGLPPKLGGSWKYEDFMIWQRQRAQYEETIGRLNGCERVSRRVYCNTEEERLERKRKRKRNVIFSRQKRERRKAESLALQTEHDTLCAENKRLKTENAQLELILRESVGAIARLQFYR